jgi:Flp pilus assembly protein TadG
MTQARRKLRIRRLTRVLRDERGVSAVEFALIAPIMIMLYVGLAQLTLGMMAERRASHAASAVGDLVAQSSATINTAYVTQVLNVGTATVQPYPTTNLSMRVTSVRADATPTAKVVWSQAQGPALTKLAVGTTPTGFPSNLLAANESVIQSDVRYDFNLPIGSGLLNVLHLNLPTAMHFSETFYLRPRRAAAIACSDCP